MSHGRQVHLDRFYDLLDALADETGGPRRLRDCTGQMQWPARGVYFFFEEGELRADGRTARVVRVGTHALRASESTLWGRLSQHRGQVAGARRGGGNHRGSVFRRHIGTALLNSGGWPDELRLTWGRGSSAAPSVRDAEHELEQAVSARIGAMHVLWLAVDDAPSPSSARGVIEAGAIALLSNFEKEPIDPPSGGWLGHHSDRPAIRKSGLWNVHHVGAPYDGQVLDEVERRLHRAR